MAGWRNTEFVCRFVILIDLVSEQQLTGAGNGLNVVKVMPESAIKFGAYEVSTYIWFRR